MMSNAAAGFIGKIPQHYEQDLGPVIFTDFAEEMAQRVARSNPKRVLETAAGTGIVSRRLRDVLTAEAALTSTDFNPPMLEVARGKFSTAERISFQQADATALPFADGGFDTVVCQFGLMFFPDKPQSYREAFRVLTPQGHYFLSTWDSHRYNPFGAIAHNAMLHFFPQDPPQFYLVPFSCYQIDPIKTDLLEAGFSDIEIAVVTRYKEIADLPAFARGMVYGNPLIDQIQARGSIAPDRIVEAVTQALSDAFGNNPARMPLQAMFYSAVKP
ncbi:class I SAM-dependent methyltransferase [Dongia soli]|uniref:Methyltransferase domain-containing protein n=1 Tax=Dongia soli TaxID=600628 RepID=A0ABU5EB30_9PROT|nr:methyltransferase domain-containing protein [Dongia soli]MDY0883469.1 methyltransferase domain-containing protein [Dongia soli]